MPLSETGKQVMNKMVKHYGPKKAKKVFYASMNKKNPGTSEWEKNKPGSSHSPIHIRKREGVIGDTY